MILTHHSKYYLIESGVLLPVAQKYRQDTIETFNIVREYFLSIGVKSFATGWHGRPCYAIFEGEIPDGFTKPNKRNGGVYPKNSKAGKPWREAWDALPKKPNAQERLKDVLGCPTWFSAKFPDGSSHGRHIGAFEEPIGLYWYSADSPILLRTPDVKKYLKEFKADGKGEPIWDENRNPEHYAPPDGLKEILREEWDLMTARHEAAQNEG